MEKAQRYSHQWGRGLLTNLLPTGTAIIPSFDQQQKTRKEKCVFCLLYVEAVAASLWDQDCEEEKEREGEGAAAPGTGNRLGSRDRRLCSASSPLPPDLLKKQRIISDQL